MLKKELLIFDLDGTLINSAPSIITSYNYAMKKLGMKKMTVSEFKKIFGLPSIFEFSMKTSDPLLIDEAAAIYRKHYVENFADKTPLFPGVKETLRHFRAGDKKLVLATSKRKYVAEAFLKGAKIYDFFDFVLGADSVRNPKPDPEIAYVAIEKTRCRKEEAAFIGDTIYDVQTARNAGITSFAFYNGFIPRKILLAEKPDFIIKSISELKEILE